MVVDRLPSGVREFASYLDGLLARLDQGGGWSGVFWQRDPDGMRACLDGSEVPPWDVVEALLEDLAAAYGPAAAAAERERARALHGAALTAYDAHPGARDSLLDRLDVMLREQRYAAERQTDLTRLLSAPASAEEAASLRLDLAWARDDHARATARCTELHSRLSELDRRGITNADEPRRPPAPGPEPTAWEAVGRGVPAGEPRRFRREDGPGPSWADGAAGQGAPAGVSPAVRGGADPGPTWAESAAGEAREAVRRGVPAGEPSGFHGLDSEQRRPAGPAAVHTAPHGDGSGPRSAGPGSGTAPSGAVSVAGEEPHPAGSAASHAVPDHGSPRADASGPGPRADFSGGPSTLRAEAAGPAPRDGGSGGAFGRAGFPAVPSVPGPGSPRADASGPGPRADFSAGPSALPADASGPAPHAGFPAVPSVPDQGSRGADAGGPVPRAGGSGGAPAGDASGAPVSPPLLPGQPSPADGGSARAPYAAGSGPAPYAPAQRPAVPGAGASGAAASPDPAKPRKRRRGSARFAGMADDGGGAPDAVEQAPLPVMPEAPARRVPRGARFAGVVEAGAAEPVGDAPVDVEAAAAVAGVVRRLARLRAEGRSGEAHVLLAEVAQWPAGRFPPLAEALDRAGLAADRATLLWEAASLPAERLVAAADALATAGRDADGRQLLRQGVARPPEQIGAAVLRLEEEGRRRDAEALLDACVRVRTAEEAARSAAPDPRRLVPLLLHAAQAVSDERHWDIVHALRVAGHTP